MNPGAIWAGCCVIGVAVGFLLSNFWGYSVGMPIGTLGGVGVAFLLTGMRRA